MEKKVFSTARKNYGVYTDLLPEFVAKAQAERTADIRQQIADMHSMELEKAAQFEYQIGFEYQCKNGIKPGYNPVSVTGKRYHLLCTAKYFFVCAYQARTVDNDVRVAIKNGTPVFFYSPYKSDKLFKLIGPTANYMWDEIIEAEKLSGKKFVVDLETNQFNPDVDSTLVSLLNTKTPWLGNGTRLCTILDERFGGNFNQFIDYCNGKIAEIEELGDYDVDYGTTVVFKEKMFHSFYVASKGKQKGQMVEWSSDHPDFQEYWANYEQLSINVLQKFIHITYLYSIEYKPLTRMYTVDGMEFGDKEFCKQYAYEQFGLGTIDCEDDYDGTELWLGGSMEDMLRSTPLYVDETTQEDLVIQEVIANSFDFTNGTYNDTPIVDWDMRKTTLADYVRSHPVKKTGRNGYSKQVYPKSASDNQ